MISWAPVPSVQRPPSPRLPLAEIVRAQDDSLAVKQWLTSVLGQTHLMGSPGQSRGNIRPSPALTGKQARPTGEVPDSAYLPEPKPEPQTALKNVYCTSPLWALMGLAGAVAREG